MANNKSATFIFCLFMLFTFAVIPGEMIYANEIPVKQETKKEEKKETKQEIKQQKNPYADAKISIKIIPSVNKTFGYDILLYGRSLVHQPNIPGLPGHEGFTTKERAQKVAAFVVKKIRNNEMPPTVTIDDLNKMGVLK